MQVIQHQELASSQASITFSSIPQTYTDLLLVCSLRVASGTSYYWDLDLNFKGESARAWRGLYALNTSPASSSSTSFNIVGGANGNNSTASTFNNTSIYIPNYTSTGVKSISSDSVAENNSSSEFFLQINANTITNSAAVDTVTLAVSGNSFAQYSSATLYGILAGSSGGVTVS
jgi:hypothetical protein